MANENLSEAEADAAAEDPEAAAEERPYTAEPWEAGFDGDPVQIGTADGHFVAMTLPCDSPGATAQDYGNAERIVACVNALVGIQDPQDFLRRLRAELSATADHLRKVLEKVAGSDGVMLKADQWAAREQIKRAEATLREAEGA